MVSFGPARGRSEQIGKQNNGQFGEAEASIFRGWAALDMARPGCPLAGCVQAVEQTSGWLADNACATKLSMESAMQIRLANPCKSWRLG